MENEEIKELKTRILRLERAVTLTNIIVNSLITILDDNDIISETELKKLTINDLKSKADEDIELDENSFDDVYWGQGGDA